MGPALSSRLDWSLVGGVNGSNGDESMGPPSFGRFLAWLRNQTIVQALIKAKGKTATIALVSHGNFLEHDALADCWPHPKNTETYAITLPAYGEKGTELPLESVHIVYDGA